MPLNPIPMTTTQKNSTEDTRIVDLLYMPGSRPGVTTACQSTTSRICALEDSIALVGNPTLEPNTYLISPINPAIEPYSTHIQP